MKNNKAITLVALIITIIILLILAGITVATLTNSGLFDKTRTAQERYQNAEIYEQDEISKVSNIIDSQIEGSNRNSGVSYALLWEGTANTQNIKYSFKDGVGDIEDYDFIQIEYTQLDHLRQSITININSITKDRVSDIGLMGYSTRYSTMHFTDKGFYIDIIDGDTGYYLYARKIFGIKY